MIMLAIIIPYYKLTFFEETLQSLADQTDKRFKVYIGDDGSVESPTALLEKYKGKFNFVYHRFEENLGGISLTKQWKRCVALSGEEEWIMILGDDDVLEEAVVDCFYKNIEEIKLVSDVVRFASYKIDNQGTKTSLIYNHPKIERSIDSFYRETRSSLSEYVFNKKKVLEIGFRDFPLAWFSDVLAVLEFSNFKNIFSINEAQIYIRISDYSISGKKDNFKLKSKANFEFYSYLLNNKYNFFSNIEKKELFFRLNKCFINNKKEYILFFKISKIYLRRFLIKEYFTFIKSVFYSFYKILIMRVGFNPHKDKLQSVLEYTHQVIIPVYIPNEEGYFKDSFKIFQLCLESLFTTIHNKTFVTIVNNGSGDFVKEYLNELLDQKRIHEVIHTENIGKLNAVLKGLAGNVIELVTISDADVLFLPNWQTETAKIFSKIPKAGVVGIVPQFKVYETNCGNVIFDNFFNPHLKFIPVKNPNALIRFYDSLGWDRSYNQDYLKYNLGLEVNTDLTVLIGSGHFVATYKKDMFQEITTYLGYKLGGDSEGFLDKAPLKKGYWRLTTYDNYAYHMGNVYEDWMAIPPKNELTIAVSSINFTKRKQMNAVVYFIKNRLFVKFLSVGWMNTLFLLWKKLPKNLIDQY
jgi:glycosyltransferase involved in cell wall biosynthesis